MASTDIGATTTSNLKNLVRDFSVTQQQLDSTQDQSENYWDFPDFATYLGYYKTIPELKKAIDSLAIWTIGKGFETDSLNEVILEHVQGYGKDTFLSVLMNAFIIKKFHGDSFTEIIREDNDDPTSLLINLKPMDPSTMRIVTDKKGMIIRYEQRNKSNKTESLKPHQVLHLVNDRIGDEIHGTGVIEACKWVIDARNEAMHDFRRIIHRSTIRIIEVDTDDTSKMNEIKTQYANAIKNGEVLIVPKDNFAFPDAPINIIDPQAWIQYLENFFYQAVGVPRVIATSENYTEAASKVGYLTFEPVYTREQELLEKELWNQLAIQLKFNRPPSLMGNVARDEQKNTGQVGFQSAETGGIA